MSSEQDDELSSSPLLYEKIYSFINNELGSEIQGLKKVPELYRRQLERKTTLEKQFEISSEEAPRRVKNSLDLATNFLGKISNIQEVEDRLACKVLDHLSKVDSTLNSLERLQSQIEDIQKYITYLKWITQINKISSNLESDLVNQSNDGIVDGYGNLIKISEKFENSECLNLVKFIDDTIVHWHKLATDKFGSEIEEVFKVLKWPIVTSSQLNLTQDLNSQMKEEALNKTGQIFAYLLKLQLPPRIWKKRKSSELLNLIPELKLTVIPLEIILKPFQKRFFYHFMGKKQTNSLEKPEWYFTQVLSWIRDNNPFLDLIIQPVLDRNEYNHVNAKIDFIKGMVQLISQKLYQDIPSLLNNDHLLSHTIDEALLFDKELHCYGYSGLDDQPGCLTILTSDNECFQQWLNMEKKYAVAKIDKILSSPSCWNSIYAVKEGIDELKVPECGEQFMTLIHTITDRYKCIPHPVHQLKFVNLQLELLDDFRLRLVQLMKEVEIFESNFCPILNAVNYIVMILNEWSDLPFFLQMLCYKMYQDKVNQSFGPNEMSDDMKSEREAALANQLASINKSGMLLNKILETTLNAGTIFDECIDLLKHVQSEMILKIVEYVIMDVKAKSRQYRKEKWFSMKSYGSSTNLSVSSSLCPMLIVLQSNLQKLKDKLAQDLFSATWKDIASSLNTFLLEEVVLMNVFNDGGAIQFNYDMNRNFFPLFSEFTQRPENYFKEVKEACILLSLPQGSALLLFETLLNDNIQNNKDALAELGINRLNVDLAKNILKQRSDVST